MYMWMDTDIFAHLLRCWRAAISIACSTQELQASAAGLGPQRANKQLRNNQRYLLPISTPKSPPESSHTFCYIFKSQVQDMHIPYNEKRHQTSMKDYAFLMLSSFQRTFKCFIYQCRFYYSPNLQAKVSGKVAHIYQAVICTFSTKAQSQNYFEWHSPFLLCFLQCK